MKNILKVTLMPLAVMVFTLTVNACNSQVSNTTANADTSVKATKPAEKATTKFLVDVRTQEEFAEGTAKGAVNIPLNEIESRLKEFQGKKEIVVFCRSGSRSSAAMSILQRNGISNVTNGGTWQDVASEVGSTLD